MDSLIVLSLGSNMDDRSKNIKDAVSLIEKEFDVHLKKSPVYDTPPLFYTAQPNFFNCCVAFRSRLDPYDIFQRTVDIENKIGRQRGGQPQGPRTIDIDLVFAGDTIIADDKLTIPHPGMQDRLFVLQPLCDIYPELVHPALLMTITELLEECEDDSNIKRIRGFWK